MKNTESFVANAAEFQGDERDIVFLSMVDDPPENGALTLREDGQRKIYKNAITLQSVALEISCGLCIQLTRRNISNQEIYASG